MRSAGPLPPFVERADDGVGHSAGTAPARSTQRLVDFAELVTFVGVLNLLVMVTTLAGGVLLGWPAALAAAVACSRQRLIGDDRPVIRSFLTHWRQQFLRANLLQAPGNLLVLVLLVNHLALAGSQSVLAAAIIAACAVVVVNQMIVVTMDAHYELGVGPCLYLATRFMIHSPGAPLLLSATLVMLLLAVLLLPGLLPVFAIGTAVHLCTGLCLSFFAANDQLMAGHHH